MAGHRTEYNEQVNQWRQEHIEQYEAPTVDNVIVGFSGIDPDKKGLGEAEKADVAQFVKENIQELSEEAIKGLVDQAIAAASDDLPSVASDDSFDEMLAEAFGDEQTPAQKEADAVAALLNDPAAAEEAAKLYLRLHP